MSFIKYETISSENEIKRTQHHFEVEIGAHWDELNMHLLEKHPSGTVCVSQRNK